MLFKFQHRENKREEDGRIYKGQIAQITNLPENIEKINVIIKCDGASDIRPCRAKGVNPAIGVLGDVDYGVVKTSPIEVKDGTANLLVEITVNPYRREPWLYIACYETTDTYYEPENKEVDGNNITFTFNVLKR